MDRAVRYFDTGDSSLSSTLRLERVLVLVNGVTPWPALISLGHTALESMRVNRSSREELCPCGKTGYLVERLTPGGRRLYALMAGTSSGLPDELPAHGLTTAGATLTAQLGGTAA
jgi:hypothetical protein